MRHEFQTADLPAADRVDAWLSELTTHTGGPFAAVPPRSGLVARIDAERLGRLSLLRLQQNSVSNERGRREVAEVRGGAYGFLIQLRGESSLAQGGEEIVLAPGACAFFDGTTPFKMSYRGENLQLNVRIPPDLVQDAGQATKAGRVIGGGLARVASALAQSTFDNASAAGEAEIPVLEDALLSVVMAAVAAEPQKSVQPPRLAAIDYFIAANVSANLSAQAIAAAMGLSVRHLQRLVAASGQSLSERIRTIRLEKCAEQLRNPARAEMTITEIAYACGFNDSAYFSRAFKQQLNEAPRDYRRRFTA